MEEGSIKSKYSDSPSQERAKLSTILGLPAGFPEEHKNVVRIFLSSTFTDMSLERNTLMAEVFPRLKSYCQQSYNQQFQVVDMRWGVQDQANDDHSTSELCMREIINCQRESAGPNFVLLLGNRYGTRYLKKSISVEHWNILTSHIQDGKVKELLDTWYKEDTNSIPSQYILQSISSVENGKEVWNNNSKLMYDAVSKAALEARAGGEMSAEIAQEYIRSVTEEEVDIAGILSDNEKQKTNCLVFVRQINRIDLQHPKAKRFIDMTEAKEKDKEGQDLLSNLTQKVKASMPSENIKEYSVDWSDTDGINAEDHKDYLQKFSDDFYNEIKRMVDTAAASEDQTAKVLHEHKLCREVLAHSRLAQDKLSKVVPRTDILDQIKSYVTGDSNQPIVVHGHSGCGKTSVMASVATQCREWLGNGDKTAVILRFLGTTQQSSDIELLLESLNHQLSSVNSMNLSIKHNSNKTLKGLAYRFKAEINSSRNQVVIVLDSLDQLRKNDYAFNLAWLPETLPPNVKLIVSTLPDIYGILKAARSLGFPENNFLEVKSLDESSAWAIIDKWLEMSQRKLTANQREAVTSVFKDKPLPPLYIKLIFDILVKWRSYEQATSIPTDVISCMEQLFSTLENTHGKLQVGLALCYLTCCPGGISQTELEDTLSIDDSFLTVVFQYHIPPLRRIPPTLWVRIKNDIRDYIVEKESNGVAAMYWYHRQFIEFATRRYVAGEQIKHCLTTLSDYFTSKWSDRPKPFAYTESQMKKLNLTDSSAQALRLVASQPTRYSKQKFNTRKVSVLSQIWSDENLKEMVFINSSRYIMDIQFLTAKFSSDSWSNMESELSAFSSYMTQKGDSLTDEEKIYSTEYTYLYSVLSMYNGLISQSPYTCSAQLFACLQDKYNLSAPKPPSDVQLPNFAWFLKDLLSGRGSDLCPLLPVSKILDSPGGMQVLVKPTSRAGCLFPFSYKGKRAVASTGVELTVYFIEEQGLVTEAISITDLEYSNHVTRISLNEEENYLLANSKFGFQLISLENKRVDLDVDELLLDEADYRSTLDCDHIEVFYNPLTNGKDSIMIHICGTQAVAIYSVKLRQIVWSLRVTKGEGFTRHMSVHDTDQDHVKELVVVFSKHTDVYTMELQEDGGAVVSLRKVLPNTFSNEGAAVSDIACSDNRMSVVGPAHLLSNRMLAFSDKTDMQTNIWSCYRFSRIRKNLLAGRLRSGNQLLVTFSSFRMEFIIELYSMKGHRQVELSAAISSKEMQLKPLISLENEIYLAPKSNVLLLLLDLKVYFFLLTELNWPTIQVTFCYSMELDIKGCQDIIADPFGYLVVNSHDNSTKFWDLTLYSDTREVDNTRLPTNKSCIQMVNFPAPHNYVLTVHDKGHIWDVATNYHMGALPAEFEDSLLLGCKILPGDGNWQYVVYAVSTRCLVSVGVNLPSCEGDTLEMEQLNLIKLQGVQHTIIQHDQGMLLSTFHEKDIENVKEAMAGSQEAVKLFKPKDLGSIPPTWCFTGNYLLGSLTIERAVVIYDVASSFNLIKKLEDCVFSDAVYFKNFDIMIALKQFECDHLYVLDTEALDLKVAKFPDLAAGSPRITMLDTYTGEEDRYCTDEQPYFFIKNNKGIVRLDVKKWKDWANGEGVIFLGDLSSDWQSIRLSTSRSYIAGVAHNDSSIELAKLTQDTLVPMGLFTFQGSVSRFLFSSDDNYITSILESGKVVCMKVLDVASPDFEAEVGKLPCTQNKICETQEEMLSDPRWSSIAALKRDSEKRTEDTLHAFMERFVRERNKPAYSLLGDELNKAAVSWGYFGTYGGSPPQYKPAVNTKPLDVKSICDIMGIPHQEETAAVPNPPIETQSTMNIKPVSKQSLPADIPAPPPADIPAPPPADTPAPPPLPPQELEVPTNLRLYQEMPTEERENSLDKAVGKVNSKYSTVCSIL